VLSVQNKTDFQKHDIQLILLQFNAPQNSTQSLDHPVSIQDPERHRQNPASQISAVREIPTHFHQLSPTMPPNAFYPYVMGQVMGHAGWLETSKLRSAALDMENQCLGMGR
jgi:hypothetical protein